MGHWGHWIRTFLVAGGLLCGLAPITGAQGLAPGQGMYREDSAHSDGHYGVFSLAVRRAIGSGLCGTDGDYCAMQVDANGALQVVFANTTIAATQSGGWSVGQSGTWTVQPGNAANTTPWLVRHSDGSNNTPIGDAVGRAIYFRLTDGADNAAINVSGHVLVDIASISANSGYVPTQDLESLPDDGAFSPVLDRVFPMGAFADDSAPDAVNEGDIGAPRMSLRRELYIQLRDAAGNERGANVNASNALLTAQTGALPAGTNNIGDVDVVSSALPTGASTLAEQQTQTVNQSTIIGHVDGVEGLLTTIDADTSALAGTVYTEGDTDTTISGRAILVEGPSDTVVSPRARDLNSGAGVENYLGVQLLIPGGSGPTELGTAAGTPMTVTGISSKDGTYGASFLRTLPAISTAAAPSYTEDRSNPLSTDLAGNTRVADAAAQASLSVIDDWDESDRAKVNPIVGQAGVQGGAGAVSATTQRVALATDANVVDRRAVTTASDPGSCVTVDTSSDTILASNADRRGATILNTGSVTVFMKFGATATTAAFPVAAGGVYNMIGPAIYTGVIDGITASSSASVCKVEW